MQKKIKPLLIIGTPRSGTTWLGKQISLSKYFHYVHEFMNPQDGLFLKDKPFGWQEYLTCESFKEKKQYFEKLFNFNYWNQGNLGIKLRLIEQYNNKVSYLKKCLFGYPQPILKEPNASFSSEFFFEKYDIKVIVIVRHPAAVVSSFKRVEWNVGFIPILSQNKLMQVHLTNYKSLMEQAEKDVVENVSILWLIIMDVLAKYIKNNPQWLLIRHEDLSNNPLDEFAQIFNYLGIPFTNKIRKIIVKQTSGKIVIPDNKNAFVFERNSKKLTTAWKNILNKDEIKTIKKIVTPISKYYYSESEW